MTGQRRPGRPEGDARPAVTPDAPPRDDAPVLPDRAEDDTDTGWAERVEDDDDRWHAERPPHWG